MNRDVSVVLGWCREDSQSSPAALRPSVSEKPPGGTHKRGGKCTVTEMGEPRAMSKTNGVSDGEMRAIK